MPKNITCKKNNNCVPTSNGAIRIENCLPEKNSTIVDMLLSFQRNLSEEISEPLIQGQNITSIIFRVYGEKGERKSVK